MTKKIKLLVLILITSIFSVNAQETMYMMRGGIVVNTQNTTELDSIIFYNPVPPPEPGDNLVTNGDFSLDMENWGSWTYTDGGRTANFNVVNGIMEVTGINGGNTAGWISLVNAPINLEQSKSYTITFDARSTANRNISFGPRRGANPFSTYAQRDKSITTTMQTYSMSYTHTTATDPEAQIIFFLGSSDESVYIDNVSVTEGSPNNGISLKIIPIGDSISQGNGDADWGGGTYRRSLYFNMIDQGYNVDMVGTMTTMANGNGTSPFGGVEPSQVTGWDYNHECYWGYNATQVNNLLTTNLPQIEAPDVALIHLGTNGEADFQVSTMKESLRNIINQLRAKNSNIVIFIAKIIPDKGAFFTQFMELKNVQIAALASEEGVNLVDMYSNVLNQNDPTDWADNLHPSWKGGAKMANKWLEAINAYYGQ